MKINIKNITILLLLAIFLFLPGFLSANSTNLQFQNLEKSEKIIFLKKEILKIRIKILEVLINKRVDENKNIFEMDFDKIILKKPYSDEGGVWWQGFSGINENKYKDIGQLQMIVDYDKDIEKYVKNEIVEGINNKGVKIMALHQNIIKKQNEDTQDPYIMYPDSDIKELYIKYSLKYPKDIAEKIGPNGWMVLSEFKTTSDYRLALYIYEDENKKLYWYMHGDNVVDETKVYNEYWFKENKEKAVPVGEWFDVEIYWNRNNNDAKKGAYLKINNEKVLEYNGNLKIKDDMWAVMLFTNYASGPMEQWVANVEVKEKAPESFWKK